MRTRRGRSPQSDLSRETGASLAAKLAEVIGWAGFRALSIAEAHAGPFVKHPEEHSYLRLDAEAYSVAIISELKVEAETVRFLEHQERDSWGYDLNLGQKAHQMMRIHEWRFAITGNAVALEPELEWLGYRRQGRSWLRVDAEARMPALGAGFAAPIYPCLGWVIMPGATSPFSAAEQRKGFCTTTPPCGAASQRDVRGYVFVHGGYPERSVERRRMITIIDPAEAASALPDLVGSALALAFGEA